MKREITLICWALVISFAGSLPLGVLNISVADYIFHHDVAGGIRFSIAAIGVEMILVRIALTAVKRLETMKRFYPLFGILTITVLMVLAINSLFSANSSQGFRPSPLTTLPPEVAGFLLSVMNPLHLPFWIGWTAVLKSRQLLSDQPSSYNRFVIAIGIGTAGAFVLYGIAGHYLIGLLGSQQVLLNYLIGITLLATALLQFYKTFCRPVIRTRWSRSQI